MAALLQFPLDPARRGRPAGTSTGSGLGRTATVVIFPGIRIERGGDRGTIRAARPDGAATGPGEQH
ncbi:hypothetical protein EDC22_11641 [Tepidamorphus gemmatus]|uniref:Uncharacterized protein n=1 Tax=Tepidamorphus gemmatus TaxID=747076 RepID=A0A4R3LZF3_9HYPH|nr:hypothetical protein [Tepidamorphus gemmatus]TCT04165.1 hypothetical protein EDC22_11641 [Tepidamorphus gemmatus]